jgi:glucosamine--fructose-6-phosphate aminotransferase (isomerizing)
MCGIVGAIAERNVVEILLEGLRRLEYRGYDSAGVALLDGEGNLQHERQIGKVKALSDAIAENPIKGATGIAHTRWATHGGVKKKMLIHIFLTRELPLYTMVLLRITKH